MPQDGLYCIRNSSTKSGKVGTQGAGPGVPSPSGVMPTPKHGHEAGRKGWGSYSCTLKGDFLGAVSLVGRLLALPRPLQG